MHKKVAAGAILAAASFPSWAAAQENFGTGPYANEFAYLEELRENTVSLNATQAVGLVQAVELVIDDQVSEGCWTNGPAVKARLRAELERSGVAVYEESLSFNWILSPYLILSALGYGTSNGLCLSVVEIELAYPSESEIGSLSMTEEVYAIRGWTEIWSSTSVFSSGTTLNDQILAFAQEGMDNLTADISSARRINSVMSARSRFDESPIITQREFEDLISEPLKN